MDIESNLARIQDRIANAAARAGRSPEAIKLVAVTKSVGPDEVETLHRLGVKAFGENRLPGVADKKGRLGGAGEWHMVGNVQRRKCPDVVTLFHWVDAVDRLKLAEALQRRCEEAGKRLDVLLEVNVSGEDSKHGVRPADAPALIESMAQLDRLTVRGLMTMAPYVEDPEETRPVFTGLRHLGEQVGLPELSMGMSNDFEVAVEEGATQLRIGAALFE